MDMKIENAPPEPPKKTTRLEYVKLIFGAMAITHMFNVVIAHFLGYPHLTDEPFPEALPVALVAGIAAFWWVYRSDHPKS